MSYSPASVFNFNIGDRTKFDIFFVDCSSSSLNAKCTVLFILKSEEYTIRQIINDLNGPSQNTIKQILSDLSSML